MAIEIWKKTAYNENGKIVLVQIGNAFFKLKLERTIEDIKELNNILESNDVYLITKGK